MQHSVFDLGAFCFVRYAKDAGGRGDAQTRGVRNSAIHYLFAFSSASLLGQTISAYICFAGASQSRGGSVAAVCFGLSCVRVDGGSS